MIQSELAIPGSSNAASVVRERCRPLGLWVWRLSASGEVLERPGGEGIASDWFSSPVLGRLLGRAVKAWEGEIRPAPVEVFPGCWAVACVERHRRQRKGYLVAVGLGADALCAEQFMSVCAGAELDAEAARTAMRGIATHTAELIERTGVMLGWLSDDMETIESQDASLAVFSRQLAESYEEISLLYTLGKSMNQLTNPENFVRQSVTELHATLSYGWIAVRFVDESKLGRAMSGRTVSAGVRPCADGEFEEAMGGLLGALGERSNLVLEGAGHGPLCAGGGVLLVHRIVRDGLTVAVMAAGNKQGDDRQVSSSDIKLLDAASAYLSVMLDNAFLYDDQQLMFIGTLESLTAAIDAKDPYTCGHSERVSHLAAALASAHGLDEEQVERIRIAGLVHDVGKIGVPDFVLGKTGRLTDEEFRLIKAHPQIGYHILKDIPQMEDVLPGVLHHHERIDGRGYPSGLEGEGIPLMARIIGLVDSFDAMSSNRTYRSAMPRVRVFEELRDHAGAQFDAALVESFKRVDLSHYDELVERHSGQSALGGLRIPRSGLAA